VATPAIKRYCVQSVVTAKNERLLRLEDRVGGLRACVAPFAGAELASLQTRFGGHWLELLHRAENFDPTRSWQGRAPWLWPAVGRSYSPKTLARALKTGVRPTVFDWKLGRRTLPMPLHGFVMERRWRVTRIRADDGLATVECELGDNAATRVFFPFAYLLTITTEVGADGLKSTFTVNAARSNKTPMPFCVGNHITLRAPLARRGAFNSVRVSAPTDKVRAALPLGLAGAITKLDLRRGLSLGDARTHSLFVGPFARRRAMVTVHDPCGLRINVAHREIISGAPKAPAGALGFVFWSVPTENFFCPEPWLGQPNDLNTRRTAVTLRAGERFAWEMVVCVSQSAGPK